LSDDEGDVYPKVEGLSDTEEEDDAEDEDDEMQGPKKPRQTARGWKVYQRINNNGQPLVRADGLPKVIQEVRPCWYLRDSVSCTYSSQAMFLMLFRP
jgi:hypothetical protein